MWIFPNERPNSYTDLSRKVEEDVLTRYKYHVRLLYDHGYVVKFTNILNQIKMALVGKLLILIGNQFKSGYETDRLIDTSKDTFI